jgi:hypothetical protein
MFQTWWLNVTGFGEHFPGKLTSFFVNLGVQHGSIEAWNCIARNSRQFLKGWGANLGKEKKEFRASLIAQIAVLDTRAD